MQLKPYLLALCAAVGVAACGTAVDCPPGTVAGSGGVCQLADAGPMCSGDTPFELGGVCVECLINPDCPTGVCGEDNVCAECANSSDCPTDRPQCNAENECVECLTTVHCGDAALPICADETCVACDGHPTCLDDALPYCLADRSACVECVADDACPEGRCEPTAHECVECLENADCTEGEATFCNTTTNTCVECLGDGDCTDAGAPFCSPAGACVPCLTDTHCTDAGAPWCDLDANTCVECLTNDHCGTTAASECGEAGECVTCTEEASCTHLVDTPHCALGGGGCVECRPTATDCGPYSCDPVSTTCTTTQLGSVGLCEPCINGTECATGVCVRDALVGAGQGVCLPERATPSSSCPPVYQTQRSALDTTGVMRDYCRPLVACANVLELYDLLDPTTPTVNCTLNSQCEPLNRCAPVSGYSGSVCTVICNSALDCPAELGGGACEPVAQGSSTKICNGG